MTTFKNYRDLEVWQRAMRLVKRIYEATQKFPTDERFGLTNQMRRAAVSVPSNLAEGHARFGAGEFSRFLSITMGLRSRTRDSDPAEFRSGLYKRTGHSRVVGGT